MQDRDARLLQNSFSAVQVQAADIHALIYEEQAAKLRHWELEEKGELEQMISSLLVSQDILKKEKKRIKAAYHTTFAIAQQQQAAYVKSAAEQYKRAHPTADVVDLQTKLVELNNRLLDIDLDIKVVNRDLAQAAKRDEKELHSTRLVVMQDTQRILQSEIDTLRSNIFHIETAAKLEAEKRSAEDTGFAALFRVEEQLSKIASRIDKAKQQLLFPESKGYQFSTGDTGVYIGCQDLFLSEVSGRFEVRCKRVTKPNGTYAASLLISFGGVSCSTDSAEARMNTRPGAGGEAAAVRNASRHARHGSVQTDVPATSASQQPSPFGTPAGANSGKGPQHHRSSSNVSDPTHTPAPPVGSPSRPSPLTQQSSPEHSQQHPHQQSHPHTPTQPNAPSTKPQSPTPAGLGQYQQQQLQPQDSGGLPAAYHGKSSRSHKEHAHPKGEMVASFLSGLSRKKEKYKKKAEQDPTASTTRTSSGRSLNFGDKIEHKFNKFGEHMRDGMGLGSKGKLSKLGKLIAVKAPKSSPKKPDDRFGDDVPSKYYHVPDDRSPNRSGELPEADFQNLSPEYRTQLAKNPDMLEAYLNASADAAGQPPEEGEADQEQVASPTPPRAPSTPGSQLLPPPPAQALQQHGRSTSNEQLSQNQRSSQAPSRAQSGNVPGEGEQANGSSAEPTLQQQQQQQQQADQPPQQPPAPTHQRQPSSSRAPEVQKTKTRAEKRAEEGVSVAFEEFEAQPARNGVYCQILGEQVEVQAEKGTRVPDVNVKELMLEIELVANTLLEWTPAEGWREGRPVNLKVLQLEHKMRGNLMNLPPTAIKGLLHLFLPSYLGKTIVASLPPELGHYVVEANEDVHLSGELRLFGQALGTYMADVLTPVMSDAVSKKKQQQQQQASARARGLLGLTEAHGQAVNKVFSVLSNQLPNQGLAIRESNKHSPVGSVASICQMCRFYLTYSNSRYWGPLCALWNRALQAAFLYTGVPESERFSFSHFMDVRVARLVRKPVRVSFMIDRLKMGVDIDAALNSLKELFARLAKDYHRRSLGHPALHDENGPVAPREPLEVQLENLELWHASMLSGLRSFKARFRAASCTLMAMADKDEFQFGAENAAYDGPLHFSMPMNFSLDPENSFAMDVRLPDQRATMNSVTAIIQDMLFDMSSSALEQQEQPESSEDGTAPQGSAEGEAAGLVQKWQELVAVSDPKAIAAAAAAIAKLAGGEFKSDGVAASAAAATMAATSSADRAKAAPGKKDALAAHLVVKNPVVGQLLARRMNFSLKLDEERLAALLASNPQAGHDGKLLGLLMACYGDLFNTALDVGWSESDSSNMPVPGGLKPKCMLKVANNKVTRATATVESLMFQSIVSPGKAVKMIEQLVIPAMLRFYPRDSSQMRWWTKVFEQLYEYFGKEALDALMCVSARAEVVRHPEPKPSSKLQAAREEQQRLQSAKQIAQQAPHDRTVEGLESWVAGSKLRVVLAGGSTLAEEPPASSSSALGSIVTQPQSGPSLLGQVAPIYVVNDVNLLTLLDTVKLLMESSSG